MERLNILIDTNVFITLDPLSTSVTAAVAQAAPLQGLIQQGDHRLFVHPYALADLRRDTHQERHEARLALLGKYVQLPDPPKVTEEMITRTGGTAPRPGGNNDVDNHHLAAVEQGAVSWLVTEDQGLIRKAQRLGLEGRVGTIAEAIVFLKNLSPEPGSPPLHVQQLKAHAIDLSDPIFESLRQDYDFDEWFERKCKPEHRDVLVIPTLSGAYAGICILKIEERSLKLSTFKIAAEYSGHRYGELLLRAAFDRCRSLSLDSCYLTVFEKQEALIAMLEDFGFHIKPQRKQTGELVMTKHFVAPPSAARLGPLDHHITYGPGAVMPVASQIFIVPVKPEWARLLLPDVETFQYSLFAPKPVANAMRKAYLANANLRTMRPGATLLFYLSERDRTVRAVGVLEDALVSRDPATVASFVGKRTVYSMSDITGMCESRDVLALLFRQDRILTDRPITLDELKELGLGGVPQSISTLHGEEAATWLKQRLAA